MKFVDDQLVDLYLAFDLFIRINYNLLGLIIIIY